MKLSEFEISNLTIPSELVTVREFAKLLDVPDQMIHQYTTKGTIECNREFGQKRVDVSSEKTLTWLVKYVSKRTELKDSVIEFLKSHIDFEEE